MKKLMYHSNVWVSYPFSMDLCAHTVKEARSRDQKVQEKKEERKSKFRLALGW